MLQLVHKYKKEENENLISEKSTEKISDKSEDL